jgi:hypothetical protein
MVMAEDLLCGDDELDQGRLLARGHWLFGRPRKKPARSREVQVARSREVQVARSRTA